MAERLREFGRFDLDLLDSAEYLAMPASSRNDAYLYMLILTGWSRKRLTDGVVPLHITRHLAARMSRSAAVLLRVLHKVGLVSVEHDHVVLLKFTKWQETKNQVEARQLRLSELGRRGGLQSAANRTVNRTVEAHAQADGEQEKRREEKRRVEESRERVTVGFQKPRYDHRQIERYVTKADGTLKGVGEVD